MKFQPYTTMKKTLLSFLLCMLAVVGNAQTSICGVDFGASYSTAERILENKFGDKEYFLSDKTRIVFNDKIYAGRMWTRMQFLFQSDGYQQYFNRCILVKDCKTLTEAKEVRDAIKKQMEEKYFIMDFTNETTKLKFYLGGMSPVDSSMYGFCIDIIKYDSGEYAARLDYGPYDYVKEEL